MLLQLLTVMNLVKDLCLQSSSQAPTSDGAPLIIQELLHQNRLLLAQLQEVLGKHGHLQGELTATNAERDRLAKQLRETQQEMLDQRALLAEIFQKLAQQQWEDLSRLMSRFRTLNTEGNP